jgi:hypothetical protein
MFILYIIILFLTINILFLSLGLYFILKKNVYLSDKEKEFIKFAIDIYQQYFNDDVVESKEQHEILVKELEKIKNKL